MTAMPMQPIETDPEGTIRFKRNRIVEAVYECSRRSGYGMNEIHTGDYTDDERMQFAQLIGYSVSGYGTLSYVSDESYDRATAAAGAAPQEPAKCCRQRPCLRPGMGPCDLPAEVREAPIPAAQWISVTDRLPAYCVEVLVWPRPTKHHYTAILAAGWDWRFGRGTDPCDVTHWMPLPAPPAPAGTKELP